mgnify:CR=1 FL=1
MDNTPVAESPYLELTEFFRTVKQPVVQLRFSEIEKILDVTIRRIREKLEDDPSQPTLIVTRRGRGYVFAGQQ